MPTRLESKRSGPLWYTFYERIAHIEGVLCQVLQERPAERSGTPRLDANDNWVCILSGVDILADILQHSTLDQPGP